MSAIITQVTKLWLYCLKRAVWVVFIAVTIPCLRLSFSQSGDDEFMNETEIFPPCPPNMSCEDLPARCIECSFDDNCTYGQNTTVNCTALETVECNDPRSFDRTFECRFCYQLPVEDTCCSLNDECSVRGTPNSLYIANCTTLEDVLCLPPRNFTKQLRCNYSNGIRWSTAFLLSFTLGGFGVDRFYLQHWGAACGKLITFGGLGVWSILDVLLIGTGYLGPADGSAYIF